MSRARRLGKKVTEGRMEVVPTGRITESVFLLI